MAATLVRLKADLIFLCSLATPCMKCIRSVALVAIRPERPHSCVDDFGRLVEKLKFYLRPRRRPSTDAKVESVFQL